MSIPVHLYRRLCGIPSPFWHYCLLRHDCLLRCALRRSHLNLSLKTWTLTDEWKSAVVCTIFAIENHRSRNNPSNYRPVSLLSPVGKTMGALQSSSLSHNLVSQKIVCDHQFGFLPGRSTTIHLVYLSALKWFINYLPDRQQQVRCGNTVSTPTSCSRGVPQGSVLGPLLFLLYTRKVPEVLSATKTIKSVLFADDILIYCSEKTPTTLAACLFEAATRLTTWLAERGLCINVNKTKAMFLPPKHQQCPADILIRCCDATLSIVNK